MKVDVVVDGIVAYECPKMSSEIAGDGGVMRVFVGGVSAKFRCEKSLSRKLLRNLLDDPG